SSRRAVAARLETAAEEVYRYFGTEFIYREDTKQLFPAALAVELRLQGCDFGSLSRDVLYKGHTVHNYSFDFYFRDGSVANTIFYRKPEQVDEEAEKLKSYARLFGIRSARLVAFPEKETDQVRVVSV
ncbi:MAG: GxxExxY protein, partial [candidate division WOR-3 bacterium]